MPPVGFEPTISASVRPQTYNLDRAARGPALLSFTKPYIAILLSNTVYEYYGIVLYDTVLSGTWVSTFQKNMLLNFYS